MDKIVQYIICRQDLKMGAGKLAAQVAHASLGSVLPYHNEAFVHEWLGGASTKVILRAKTFQQLTNLVLKLEADGIKHKVVWDSCLTEISPETDMGTLTCVGICPIPKSLIYPYVKKFQLY